MLMHTNMKSMKRFLLFRCVVLLLPFWLTQAVAQDTQPAATSVSVIPAAFLDDAATVLLKAWIAEEYPSVADPRLSDWQRVTLLRDWTHRHIDWASESALLETTPGVNIQNKSAAELFAIFKSDGGGVWCGGAAITLRKLYEAYGYEAVTLDAGFPGTPATHVVTIVRIKTRDGLVLSLQDPTFNHTYVNENRSPIDVVEMMDLLAAGQGNSIYTEAGPCARIDLIVDPKDEASFLEQTALLKTTNEVTTLPNGRWKFKSRRPLAQFMTGEIAALFHEKGYPPQLRYIFLHPLGTTGSADEDFDRLASRIVVHVDDTVELPPPQISEGSHAVAQVLSAEEATYVADNVKWLDTSLVVSGRAENRFTYLVRFLPVVVTQPRDVVFEGELKTGGITIGVVKDGQWSARHSVNKPGAFHSLLKVEEPGEYTLIIANNIIAGPVVNEAIVRMIGWSEESPTP